MNLNDNKKLRLLHITDSHLDEQTEVKSRDIKTTVSGVGHSLRSESLRMTIQELAKLLKQKGEKLDAVVISGDSTLKGNKIGQLALREMLIELLFDAGITAENIIATPGNHDVIAGSPPSSSERYELFSNAWLRPTSVISPFLDGIHEIDTMAIKSHCLVDPDMHWGIFPINSSNWSQVQILAAENPNIQLLQDHLKEATDPRLLEALSKLSRFDIARVSESQLSALRKIVESVGDIPMRIGVIHHHLLPVGSEEFKPFADITNLGELRQVLYELNFKIVIHGHKHTATAYYDHIYPDDYPARPPHRILMLSGGTFGSTSHVSDHPLCIIEIEDIKNAPICTLRTVHSATPGRPSAIPNSTAYPVWENEDKNNGPITLVSRSIDELYVRALQTVKVNPNRTLICTINFLEDSREFPISYPHKGDESQMQDWFLETVKWWQRSTSQSEGRISYIHGNRLRRFGGGFDQIERVIKLLRGAAPTSRALALVVDPSRDFLGDKKFASFCLVQFCLKHVNGILQLDCIGYYRAQEFNHWWAVNVAELRYLQLEVIKEASVRPGQILPGEITTISPYPKLSGDVRQPTKVAVPLIDQWLDNKPSHIAKITMAITNSGTFDGTEGNALWVRCLEDLEQGASVHHADGVPIAINGLEILRDWVQAVQPDSTIIPLLTDLIGINRNMPDEPKPQQFDAWSLHVKGILVELRKFPRTTNV